MKLRMRTAGAFLLLAGISACDIPSGVPRWETTWITPAEEATVSVVELLPSGIGVDDDTTTFVLAVDDLAESWQLADFCAACPAATATAPKPPFSSTVSTTAAIPAAVRTAEVDSGTIAIALTNGFDFDPLRPGVAADSGSLTITIASGGATVAQLVVDGTDQSFAPGSTLDLALDVMPSTLDGDLEIELTLDSPAGDPAELDPADALSAAVSSEGLLVSEAVVDLADQPVESVASELDLEDVDIGDRINEGSIFFDIENPFGVTGELMLVVDPSDGAPIQKPITLGGDNETVRVDFTEDEIQRLVGTTSTMTFSGMVDGGAVTIRPDMALGVAARLRVVVEVGGDSDEDED